MPLFGVRQPLAAALWGRICSDACEELTLWLRTRLCPRRQESALSQETRTLVEASQTLGAAFLAGLRPHVRCLRGKRKVLRTLPLCFPGTQMELPAIQWV